MRHTNNNKLVIFAADGIDTEDRAENLVQWFSYHGFKIKQVEGRYKGVKEISFVAPYSIIEHPLFQYLTLGQESVLILDEERENKRKASLWFLADDSIASIGYWYALDDLPKAVADYTYCPLNNAYYVVRI